MGKNCTSCCLFCAVTGDMTLLVLSDKRDPIRGTITDVRKCSDPADRSGLELADKKAGVPNSGRDYTVGGTSVVSGYQWVVR